MKPFVALTATAAMLCIVACGPSDTEIATEKAKREADSLKALSEKEQTYAVDLSVSRVNWTGTMLGMYSHSGELSFKEGSFSTKGGQLTGGNFVVDMKSYAMLDTNYAPDGSKQGTRADLMGHLMSPQFFAADSFPTSTLRISSVNGNTASAELTIRGRTEIETITDIELLPVADGSMTAIGKLVFDRKKYGVAWDSPKKESVLGNNIELVVKVSGKAQ